MIVGHGYDIVCMPELGTLLAERASAFIEATFTARELAYANNELRHLAARYAAKEAALKAFGSAGANTPIPLCEIEVIRALTGAPSLSFSRNAAELAMQLAVTQTWLSLSHDGDYATASVILERRE